MMVKRILSIMSDSISQIVPAMPESTNEDMKQWAIKFDSNLKSMCSSIDSGFGRQYTEVNHLLQKQHIELQNEINKLKQEINDLQKKKTK